MNLASWELPGKVDLADSSYYNPVPCNVRAMAKAYNNRQYANRNNFNYAHDTYLADTTCVHLLNDVARDTTVLFSNLVNISFYCVIYTYIYIYIL